MDKWEKAEAVGAAVKGFLSLGGVCLALYGVFGERALDVLGDKGKKISKSEAEKAALVKYQRAYEAASPAGKFVLQYVETTKVAMSTRGSDDWGILDALDNESNWQVKVNNGCLKRTAYDIAGGQIKGEFSGVFSSGYVEGDVPTAAAYAIVDEDNTNELVVQSGHSNSADLRFSGVNGTSPLKPADEQTRRVLDTYGCNDGQIQAEIYYRAESSAYIK